MFGLFRSKCTKNKIHRLLGVLNPVYPGYDREIPACETEIDGSLYHVKIVLLWKQTKNKTDDKNLWIVCYKLGLYLLFFILRHKYHISILSQEATMPEN